MKKVKLLISFLLFLLFTSSQVKAECSSKAQDIPIYKVKKHLGTRTTEPSVTATLEQNQLTVNVSRYAGIAKVYVYDNSGNLLVSSSVIIEGNGTCSLDLSELEWDSNEIVIKLGDITFWGVLDVE